VLHVTDLANAIARAEEVIRARTSGQLGQSAGPFRASTIPPPPLEVSQDGTQRLPAFTFEGLRPSNILYLDSKGTPTFNARFAGRAPAESVLEDTRDEPTLFTKIRSHRAFLWIAAAAIAPFMLAAVFLIAVAIGRARAAHVGTASVMTMEQPRRDDPAPAAVPVPVPVPVETVKSPSLVTVPVSDVNSLPPARTRRQRR
jgi:hypothetical protein